MNHINDYQITEEMTYVKINNDKRKKIGHTIVRVDPAIEEGISSDILMLLFSF